MPQKQEEGEEIQFVDAEDYRSSPQGAMTYEQIVLKQINRCADEGSKEMIGGYIKEKATNKGLVEVYVPDQREIYIQSITMLHDLLLSFFDDEMKESIKSFDEALAEARTQKMDYLREAHRGAKNRYDKMEIESQIKTGFIDRDSFPARQFMEDKLEIYRFLFQELMLLYGRQRYLMAQAIDDSLDYK